ncbi:complement component C8 gamma chain isoform X2 [Diceros bicornis minor]|uniref:complement component C8 gamma chain isoform X2 n=1 Tax=Diceros bicornis minor TaxID=77932 RepID=UPI0026F01F9C|nr:complement component C8 gamma chain isoform X2 [Diceros bicornis minor]
MLPPRTALLLTLLLAAASLGQRARRPPRPPSPISTIQPKANFDAQQFAGTWLLVAVASSCRFLQEQGHRAEATTLQVAPQGAAMAVGTFQKLDGVCWQVQQLFRDTGVPGRFLLQARGARGAVDVVVGETDYRGFAVLYLERARRLSVKLYGASARELGLGTHLGPSRWGCASRGGHTDLPSLPPSQRPAPLLLSRGPGRSPCRQALVWDREGQGWGGEQMGRQQRGAGVRQRPGVSQARRPCPQSTLPTPLSPVCPTARSLPVSNSALSAFGQRVQGANLTEDHILFFPKYGEHPVSLGHQPYPPCVRPARATPDPRLDPQVSARPQTSSTSWTK